MVVTAEQYKMACEAERIAEAYKVPKDVLLSFGRLFFEAGQRNGLTAFAADTMARV